MVEVVVHWEVLGSLTLEAVVEGVLMVPCQTACEMTMEAAEGESFQRPEAEEGHAVDVHLV